MTVQQRIAAVFERMNEYSFYGLIFFIPISPAAVETFFGLLMFSFIIKNICRPDFAFLRSRGNLYLAFFVFFMTLSLLRSGPYIQKSLEALFFKWLEYILIFLIAQNVLSTPRRIRASVMVLFCGAALVSIDGLAQKMWGVDFLRQRPMARTSAGLDGLTGPFKHYNAFGGYLVSLTLMMTGLLGAALSRLKKFVLVLVLAAAFVCIFLTLSRGSWVGLVCGLVCLIVLGKRFGVLLGIASILIAVLLFYADARERILFTFAAGGDATRFALWRSALLMIREHPFIGQGLGTFMDHFPRFNQTANTYAQYAHNSFLQIWAETGIVSLLAFAAFVASELYRGVKGIGKGLDSLTAGLIAGLAGFLVHSFFDNHLYSLQLAVLFWVMLGVLAAQNRLAHKSFY